MRFKSRYIPKDSIPVEHHEGLGVAYVYRLRDKYAVVAYGGKRNSADFHYTYKTLEAAHDRIEQWFAGLEQHRVNVKSRRASSFAPHTFSVGDVVTNSWGYDQTNVDWYRVTRVSDHFVWLQEIAGHTEETGFMSGRTVPHIDTTSDDPAKWGFSDTTKPSRRHKASGSYVTMRHGCGSKWDGKERYASWYA